MTFERCGASRLYQVPSVTIFRSVIPVTDEQNLKVTIHVCWGPASRGQRDAAYIPGFVSCTCDLSLLHYTQPCIMHDINANMSTLV